MMEALTLVKLLRFLCEIDTDRLLQAGCRPSSNFRGNTWP